MATIIGDERLEKSIINLYNQLGSILAVKKVISYSEKTIRKVLKKHDIKTWKPEEFGFAKMKKENSSKFIEISSIAGRKGGTLTHQRWKDRDIYSYTQHQKNAAHNVFPSALKNNPNMREIMALNLSTWKMSNPDLVSSISRSTAKKTLQKYPTQASDNGKKSIRDRASIMGTLSVLKQAAQKGMNRPESAIRLILPPRFLNNYRLQLGNYSFLPDFCDPIKKQIVWIDGPRHYRTMGKSYGQERLNKTILKDKKQDEIVTQLGYTFIRLHYPTIMNCSEIVHQNLRDKGFLDN